MPRPRPALSALTALALLTGGGVLTAAAPASAAGYNGACGSGYKVVNSADLPGGAGTVFLTYNGSSGKNCAVTVRASKGAAKPMDVQLALASKPGSAVLDTGDFTEYAGPVRLDAQGECVTWSGIIGGQAAGKARTNCG
ncbi:spore-associated protein A [Nocardiopsis sp. RSe5-2]|uniref:Spore-associated protein A n=1 Tax=Nocardiopsis endophytica TaxID=3018445 RepID=A0ABT4UD56_9ACTN|nr:spore-associated protein A [Nocardiopsis endophytica]MDA2814280.1 spore-associated protein A [Nocardiopsis endophytica]